MALPSVTGSLAKLLSTQQPNEMEEEEKNLHVGHVEWQKKTKPQKMGAKI